MRTPRFGDPVRVAFVGQETYFAQCALHAPAGGLTPRFFDFRAGVGADATALREALDDWGAHVVVVFRPEIVPPGALHDLRAATLGFVTEPLRRAGGEEHPDLDWRESELALTDATNFDRVVAFDPQWPGPPTATRRCGARGRCLSTTASTADVTPARPRRGCCSSATRPSTASAS